MSGSRMARSVAGACTIACAPALLVMAPSVAGAQAADGASAANPAWCKNVPRPGNASLERVRVVSPWFEVRRVERDVYAIIEPRQWQEVISYLVVGKERALLFDTGLGNGDIR